MCALKLWVSHSRLAMRMVTISTLLTLCGVFALTSNAQLVLDDGSNSTSSKGIKLQNGFERVYIQASYFLP